MTVDHCVSSCTWFWLWLQLSVLQLPSATFSLGELQAVDSETLLPSGTTCLISVMSLDFRHCVHAGTRPALLPQAPVSAPTPAQSLPANLRGLADAAAAATLGAEGSHVLLISVTTAGGFCVVALALAAAVFCICRRRGKQQAYVVERKPSQASMGSSGQGGPPKPSPLQTTPKGLRQAYAKAAGLHRGEAAPKMQ